MPVGQYPQHNPAHGNMMGHPHGGVLPGMGPIYPGHMTDNMAARMNQQRMYGGMMHGVHPMQQQAAVAPPTKKHQVLPKEVR